MKMIECIADMAKLESEMGLLKQDLDAKKVEYTECRKVETTDTTALHNEM
jgi:hypothetical protein